MEVHESFRIVIIWVRVWISHPRNVHKYSDLVTMPIHRLNFILDLKVIIFNKINYQNYGVIWKIVKANFELIILPPYNKILMHKIL